ncbi:geranylgeranylglycerol-phosphate geranylgeranyltransferase [Winogradskyella ursingii]|uniref:geranylgeranylglycerol-phosphate geranylgeranyltransferase n=1 Tax=Winogradskyella ursingii TaxID=2686079 RepID=UPI0015CB8691|nr:geranylgeranylglycerol-phosphate geranylgeranyltransferase [Winogradskyella ursingii]
MQSFFKLIRWKNLLMIALVQYLIKYALLLPFTESHGVMTSLDHFHFALLVLSTMCIAAGGYVINDIYDLTTDAINKPEKIIINRQISEKNGFTIFMVLNIIGVVLGFYLANHVGKSALFVVFFAASALLYIYASALKQMLLVGNIVVSVVIALSILTIGIFELFPIMNANNKSVQILFFNIIRDYAIFAFAINLVREIIKDIEDIDGDHKAGMNTLPIAIGRERANKVAFIVVLLTLFSVIYYVITYLFTQQLVIGYFLILVIAPLIYVCIKIFNAEHKGQYNHISQILKLIMLTGMLSLALYKFVI